jgi:hypothetical protein
MMVTITPQAKAFPGGFMTLSLSRAALVVLFDRLRRGLSERCTCAAWDYSSEEEIPRLCALAVRQGVPQSWGQHEVGVPEAQALVALAGALGGWTAAFRECR